MQVKPGLEGELMLKLFGMCFNPKVLIGLAVLAVGMVVLVSLGMALRALPFLLMAACPLSMVLMMAGMGAMKLPNAQPSNPAHPPDRALEIQALRSKLEALELEEKTIPALEASRS